jgi:hypothetical protein
VLGAIGAMAVTQQLRSEGTLVSDIRLRTEEGPRYRVCFQVGEEDTYRVALVNRDDDMVRLLAQEAQLTDEAPPGTDPDMRKKATANCFDWDGRDHAGAPVPRGSYRLSLTRVDDGLELISGEKLHVTELPPQP